MALSSLVCLCSLLLVVLLPRQVASFKMCGNYCGPMWCAAEVITERDCVSTGVWGTVGGTECVDDCCMTHDYCCGKGTDRAACNNGIVQCIQKNRCYLSLCGAAVWAAMKTVADWCCSTRCPTYFDTMNGTRQMSMQGKSFCHTESFRDLPTLSMKLTFHSDELLNASFARPTTKALEGLSSHCYLQKSCLKQDTNEIQLLEEECVKSAAVKHLRRNIQSMIYLPETEAISVMLDQGKSIVLGKC